MYFVLLGPSYPRRYGCYALYLADCVGVIVLPISHIIIASAYKERPKKHFKNEERSKDAAAKKRPNTSGVGKINNY